MNPVLCDHAVEGPHRLASMFHGGRAFSNVSTSAQWGSRWSASAIWVRLHDVGT